MKRIPSLFVRDSINPTYVVNEVTPGCEWVMRGEGAALRMYDGACLMKNKEGEWFERASFRPLALDYLRLPANFIEEEYDYTTGKSYGWIPLNETSPYWTAFREVIDGDLSPTPHAGTYELCGPTINGNPEGFEWPGLVLHNHAQKLWELNGDLTFFSLRETFTSPAFLFEGIVWHHRSGDGRMAKLRRTDFPPPRA